MTAAIRIKGSRMLERFVLTIGLVTLIGLASWPSALSAAGNGESVTGTAIPADFIPPGGSPPENLVPTGPAVHQPIPPDVIKPTGRPVQPEDRDPQTPEQLKAGLDFLKALHKVYDHAQLLDYKFTADAFGVTLTPEPSLTEDKYGSRLNGIGIQGLSAGGLPGDYFIELEQPELSLTRLQRPFIAKLHFYMQNKYFCITPNDILNEFNFPFKNTYRQLPIGFYGEAWDASEIINRYDNFFNMTYTIRNQDKCVFEVFLFQKPGD